MLHSYLLHKNIYGESRCRWFTANIVSPPVTSVEISITAVIFPFRFYEN